MREAVVAYTLAGVLVVLVLLGLIGIVCETIFP